MSRELTAKEKRLITQSVVRNCANYDRNYEECLPLDGTCYMMAIGFTDSSLCRYYEKCILPIEVDVANIFQDQGKTPKFCAICGRKFFPHRKQRYCSEACAAVGKRKATARRVRKHREKQRDM